MLVLSFRPTEGATLDFANMSDAELQELRRTGCRIECESIRKQAGEGGSTRLGFVFPRNVRIVRDSLLAKEASK